MTPEIVLVLASLGLYGAGYWYFSAARSIQSETDKRLAREEALLKDIEWHLGIIRQAQQDHAEAFMLWNLGARDEAIELLTKWGVRVHVAT